MKPSKKTIITLNRFITCIQSWLVKASLLFLFILFVVSCSEDPNTIGFKRDDTRFKVFYKEITLPSSVVGGDSVFTHNSLALPGDLKRLVVGGYTDPVFGKVAAEAYTQFTPNHLYFADTVHINDVNIESVRLMLTLDNYWYGDRQSSELNLYIHELKDSIRSEQGYLANTALYYDPMPLAFMNRVIDPVLLEEHLANNTDTDTQNNFFDTLTFELPLSFGKRLFDMSINDKTTYHRTNLFKRAFKGFAIRATGEKIIGINPTLNTSGLYRSRLAVFYSYPDPNDNTKRKNSIADYSLYLGTPTVGVTGFSHFTFDKTGYPAGLVTQNLHRDTYPAGNLRYIQGGDEVFTKFDLSDFYHFADTLDNMVINSAELVVEPVEDQPYPYPAFLTVEMLNDRNRPISGTSQALPIFYSGYIVTNFYGYLILGERVQNTTLATTYDLALSKKDDGTYRYGKLLTGFFQRLYNYRKETTRITKFGLIAANPDMNKSVNRVIFNGNNLKLRLYYTIPSTDKKD